MPELNLASLPAPIEAILFDKDGTLLDFTAMWGFWTVSVMENFRERLVARGLRFTKDEIPHIWGTFHDEQGGMTGYDVRGPLAMGTMEEVHAVLTWHGYRAGLSWAEAKVDVNECFLQAEYAMSQERPARLLPGVRMFLEQCRNRGLKMGVVTADETDSARRHLEWMGIESFFTVVVGTDQVERGKPFPDMLLLACDRLGVPVARSMVIGDTDGDMEMARSAGAAWKVAIGSPEHIQLADLTVRSFHELLEAGVSR
ncbi:HAD family hydrolase [Paenibacillus peoriae]|uniref:HAD family hydrolase n=1 Tax=Paenibacillus peoriae TaxID=59893 RepID=UPI003F96BF46